MTPRTDYASTSPLREALAEIHPQIPKSVFRVFVFGPASQPDAVVEPPRVGTDSPGALVEHATYLRHLAKKRLEDEDFPVDFGETKEIIEFWSRGFQSADLASTELLHARKATGAVVIFPSSVGSFCELGLFSAREQISKKTLAIVHSGFETDKSFFRNGLLELLDQEYGTYKFADYSDHDACAECAVDFVNSKYTKMLRDQQEIADAELKKAAQRGTVYE